MLGASTAGVGAAVYRYRQILHRQEQELPSQKLEVLFDNDTTTNCNKNTKQQRPVLIIGGGVVGVTAAYKLACAGHAVALLEPASRVATECSACAAGGMQRSNPVVDRDSWMAVLQCLAAPLLGRRRQHNDNAFEFFHISWWQTLTDPFFWRWVTTFTRTSLFPGLQQEKKQHEMLEFTAFAVNDMVRMMTNNRIAQVAGYNPTGSVSLSYQANCKDTADCENDNNQKEAVTDDKKKNTTHSKRSYEPHHKLLDTSQIVQCEPSLEWQTVQPTAARYEYEAKSASAERFATELARQCEQLPNVQFLYNTAVRAISVDDSDSDQKPRISKIHTNRGVIEIKENVQVVVAAGAWTPHVLALMDLYAPVYPLKGYALSVSATEALQNLNLKPHDLPSRIVCDQYMFTSRLGDEIRITSIGEFSGWSTQPAPAVDAAFRAQAARQFPQLAPLIDAAPTRCGHRPLVSDGILLLGAADDTYSNLWVTAGPGSNGWKLAAGSGEVLTRLVGGQSPAQIRDELGFDVAAFSPAGRVFSAPVFAKLCRARWKV